MIHLPLQMRSGFLLGAILIAFGGASYAGYPVENAAQKGCKHCDKERCGHSSCCHKSGLHHRLPPNLPVLQSQAVRSRPAESEPMRMRLQVKAVEQERATEPFQEGDRPSEQFRGDDGNANQKDRATQKAQYLSPSTGSSDIDERFNRLERQVSLLLKKVDGFVEQQARRPQPLQQQSEN